MSRNPILSHPIKVFFLLPWLRSLAHVLCAVEIHFRRFVVEGKYSAKCDSRQSSCTKRFGITWHMVCTNCRMLSIGSFRSPQWLMIFFASPSFTNIEVENLVRKQMTSITYRIKMFSSEQYPGRSLTIVKYCIRAVTMIHERFQRFPTHRITTVYKRVVYSQNTIGYDRYSVGFPRQTTVVMRLGGKRRDLARIRWFTLIYYRNTVRNSAWTIVSVRLGRS